MASSELVIDRSRIAHRDTKRLIILQAIITKAEQALDVETLESAVNEAERINEKLVASVPDSFFVENAPAEARALKPGWMDWISEDAYQQVSESARAAATIGKKKDSAGGTTSADDTPTR